MSDSEPMSQNERGQWVPSIPLPFYSLKKHCSCGKSFWTEEGYRAHYALRHILYPAKDSLKRQP